MEGFLLGISNGTVCLAYCAPVIIPYFLAEGEHTGKNIRSLAEFLLGRLAGYILFAILAWGTGHVLLNMSESHEIFFGITYIILSFAMAAYGLLISKEFCAFNSLKGAVSRFASKRQWSVIGILGFLTGINFCPPFLLLFSLSAHSGSLFDSIFLFFAFFLGTSIYFLPVTFLGFLNKYGRLKTIGKMTAVLMSLYFFYKGIIMLAGGALF